MSRRRKGDSIFRVFVEKLGDTERKGFVGNEGEMFYDPTTSELFVSDGKTLGGVPLVNSAMGDLIDALGTLDGSNIQRLLDVLTKLNDDKYEKTGGSIDGVMSVDTTGTGLNPELEVNRSGVFVSHQPTQSNQVTTRDYVDTTTIPFNISSLKSISSI